MSESQPEAVLVQIESIKQDVVKDTAWYGFATYFAQGLGLISGVMIRRFLEPTGMGVWTALMLLPSYMNYSHLGVLNAAEREIPFLNGKHDQEGAALVRNIAFTVTIGAGFFSNLALLGFAIWQGGTSSPEVAAGLRLVILVALAQLGFAYYGMLARTLKQFRELGTLAIISAIGNIVAILLLASRYGVPGMLLATALVYTLMTLYLVVRIKLPVRPTLAWRQAGRLLGIGLPIMLYSIVSDTLMNIDKIATVALLGPTSLGFYTLATMVKTYAWTVPSVIGIVIYPRLQERYGATGDPARLKNMFLFPMAILAALTPIFIGGLYFGTVLLAHTFLTDYIGGLASVRNMVVGTFFLAITLPAAQLLMTLNRQIVLMVIGAAGVALAWGLNVFFVQGGWDIAGIAIGTSCAYFVTATATIVLAARHYVPSMGALFGLLLRTYLPFVYATLVLFVVDAVLPLEQLPSSATLFIIAAKLLVFLVACLPLLWYANRETGVVGLMQQALAARLSRSLARERR